ncbi:MAG: threonine synthase, partial [Oscillospiraceae bacterium]
MNYVGQLRCVTCGAVFSPQAGVNLCPHCKKEGILDVEYDYPAIRRVLTREALAQNPERSMWRYLPLLPVEQTARYEYLRVGATPLYRPKRLAEAVGLDTLWIKDDGQNPTASLKDRASALAVQRALESGQQAVACASTGNAASSLAGNAAAAGLSSYIFIPERAPEGKLAQLLIFGATVIMVRGNYQDAFELSAKAIERYGWYNRNAAINPYLSEGKKTVTLELCEQLNWQVPDWVVLSVGDGCTIAGAWKGFLDLYAIGLIDRLPKFAGIQAQGCCPIVRSFQSGRPLAWMEENTLADSIAVGAPRNPRKALSAIESSHGTMTTVTDDEILAAMKLLGNTAGIFGEPAGVAGLAGVRRLVADGVI